MKLIKLMPKQYINSMKPWLYLKKIKLKKIKLIKLIILKEKQKKNWFNMKLLTCNQLQMLQVMLFLWEWLMSFEYWQYL